MSSEKQSVLIFNSLNRKRDLYYIYIDSLQYVYQMDSEFGFQKNREEHVIQIRKENRKEIFLKMRRIRLQNVMEAETNHQEKACIVLDQNLRPLIEHCNNNNNLTVAHIQFLCKELNNKSDQIRHRAAIGLRKLISEEKAQSSIQLIVDKGIVSKLINLIQDRKYPQLQFQACWILTLIAYSSSALCQSIVEKKGVETLMQLLYQNSGPVINHALWGLGNIAGDSTLCRNKVIICGGVECVIRIVKNFKQPEAVSLGCWVLSNLCRGQPLPSYDFIKPAIPVLGQKIVEGVLQRSYLIGAIWSLCTHSQGSKSKIRQILIVQNLVAKLIDLCYSQENEIVIPSLRILGNISTGNTTQTQQLLNNHILQLLDRLIQHKKKSIRRQACWILSNIAAGPDHHVQKIIYYPNLVINLAQKLLSDEFDVRREICFIFSNCCHLGNPNEVYKVIVNNNLLQILAHQLQADEDHNLLEAALKCLYQFLAIGGKIDKQNVVLKTVQRIPSIVDRLETLQHHKSDEVYKQLSKILQRFFTLDENVF